MAAENTNMELPKELNLKEDFESPSYEEWCAIVDADLKGVPFEKKLITKTYEGIDLQPIYTKKDLEDLKMIDELPGYDNYLRGKNYSGYTKTGWEVAQQLPYPLAEDFNSALKNDLSRGQNGIALPLDTATKLGLDADYAKPEEVGDDGVSISGLTSFKRAFNEVDITKYPIHIDAGFSSLPLVAIVSAYLKEQNVDAKKVSGSITADPIAYLAKEGKLPVSFKFAYDELKSVTEWALENMPGVKTIGVSGLQYHNAGASAVQELAYTLAAGAEYMSELSERGMDVNDIAKHMQFTFGIGTFFFMEVAKLRAAKVLWAKITEAFGVKEEDRKINISAVAGKFSQTKYDPYVNMLRTTTEAFSAVVGGVDTLTTNPFDELFGMPDDFSRRIARNTQIILDEESHLTNLIDPAGGSFFVEKLTDEVAQTVWAEFQAIEAKGGFTKALQDGYPQSEITKTWESRKNDIAKRKSVIVGSNMFANIKEELKEKHTPDHEAIYKKRSDYLQKFRTSGNGGKHESILNKLQQMADQSSEDVVTTGAEAILEGATIGEISKTSRANAGEGLNVEALEERRAALLFEELRDKSEEIKNKRGNRPTLFLATMGSIKQYKARADFSQGFFEIGGFDIIYPNGFESIDEAIKAAVDSKADAVVICSTDETYPEIVPSFTKGIKNADSNISVVLAGYPKEQIEEHKKSGVDEFIYLGADAYGLLNNLLKKIN